jgi:type VI secretion system protein ImpA
LEAAAGTAALVQKLEALLESKTGRGDHVDLKPLRNMTHLLRQTCSVKNDEAQVGEASSDEAGNAVGGARSGSTRGEISTRQDALHMLDKVISFLERTEPGNPAPLLIQRAKRLVGVSFMDIMNDLAPDALGSIQNITGKPP